MKVECHWQSGERKHPKNVVCYTKEKTKQTQSKL